MIIARNSVATFAFLLKKNVNTIVSLNLVTLSMNSVFIEHDKYILKGYNAFSKPYL